MLDGVRLVTGRMLMMLAYTNVRDDDDYNYYDYDDDKKGPRVEC